MIFLIAEKEYNLNTKPLEIDFLVIKKDSHVRITNILFDMSKAGVSFERVGYIIQGKEEPYQEEGEKGQLPISMDIAFFPYILCL